MPQVTAIKPQKRQNRFNIFLDGKFAFALDADNLFKSGLQINQEISQDKIEKLIKEYELVKVFDHVLNFFSFRPRSEKELDIWFIRKQIGEETQKLIKQKLKDLHYLNDEEFAKWWIEQRMNFRPKSKKVIGLELKQKGINKEIIVRLLDCYIAKDSEEGLARKIAEKYMKKIINLPQAEQRQKLQTALLCRGFTWETIKGIVDEIIEKR